jgi:hypothetical protein
MMVDNRRDRDNEDIARGQGCKHIGRSGVVQIQNLAIELTQFGRGDERGLYIGCMRRGQETPMAYTSTATCQEKSMKQTNPCNVE